jgi:hypothetical protein
MLLAFALLAVPAPHAQSAEVMQVYREACVEGGLRLTAERGRVVRWEELPEFARDLRWGDLEPDRTTYVAMKAPPSTYVALTHFKPGNRAHLASECIVASRSIRIEDAAVAFFEGTPKAHPIRYLPWSRWWDIDVPEQGYRKTLWVASHSKYVVLQTTLYDRPAAAAGPR